MLLARLKQETRHLHQHMESSLDLLRSEFSLEDYRFVLRRFYGYYSPWEARILAVAPRLVEGRGKCAKLARDLIDLGMRSEELSLIERCRNLPRLDTVWRVLGSMYVLEGATLGGQILNRHMRSHFGLDGNGCAFFSGYGENTSVMWKQFGQLLETSPANSHDEIISSAVSTFESVERWVGVPRS